MHRHELADPGRLRDEPGARGVVDVPCRSPLVVVVIRQRSLNPCNGMGHECKSDPVPVKARKVRPESF